MLANGKNFVLLGFPWFMGRVKLEHRVARPRGAQGVLGGTVGPHRTLLVESLHWPRTPSAGL